ncbi:hypothetical protein WS72_04090 [Burkholderia savannae]|uniref:Uncharacterized protein n=1 Tax=Burkholderia savannae TaxID=1637837 RepID=A0ABR5TIA6_9BURK|nr:hypothetical protein WS72_04090 [Burkholderia savannae]
MRDDAGRDHGRDHGRERVASRRIRRGRKNARLQRRVQAGQFRVIGRFAARGERLTGGEYEGGRANAPIVLSDCA